MNGIARRVLAGLLAAAWPAAAQEEIPESPQTYVVDVFHQGEEEGTSDRPFSSIAEAIDNVIPGRGDTVLVRPASTMRISSFHRRQRSSLNRDRRKRRCSVPRIPPRRSSP